MKSLVEQGISTGQVFVGSKFAGVAKTACALGGTGLPPCAAYDFSCELKGTLAWTVEPGEKGTPAKFKEAWAASAANVETTFRMTSSRPIKNNVFKKVVVRVSISVKAGSGNSYRKEKELRRVLSSLPNKIGRAHV